MLHLKKISTGRRVFVISDVHGCLPVLKELLQKCRPDAEDTLIFAGDYINRGPFGAETLRYIRALSERPNTVVLKGNMDRCINWYLYSGDDGELAEHAAVYPNNLLAEWARECGIERVTPQNIAETRALLRRERGEEAEWVRALPLGVESEYTVFVHAGTGATEQNLLKNDSYLREGVNDTGKWVVCGHTPVWNCEASENTNNPVIDRTRKIAFIDGGMAVKNFSQLNALCIEQTPEGPVFTNTFADGCETFRARSAYTPERQNIFLKDCWPDYMLEVLCEGESFSRCRLTVSRREGDVKNEHIARDGNTCRYKCSSCSSLLTVSEGESLTMLDDLGTWKYVRKTDGRIGWIKQ